MSMRDRQLREDHHSDDRDAGRRYVQMIDEVHLDETDASGSRDFPCRAVFLRPLPKLPPHEGALSSNELPAKPTRRPTEGHDQMGEWIQPSPDSCVYWYRNAIHLTPLCDAFPLEGIPVSLCYCIGKLYKKMHYMVGYDGCLHEACGCSLDSPPAYITQCIFAQALYVFAVLAFPCHSRLLNSIPKLTLTLGRIFEVLIACERLPMLDVQREW